MPVSLVIGGQFGSEGKGKVALEIARRAKEPVTVVRVGGTNSGHTGYSRSSRKHALRQLPAGCIDRNVNVVFPPGSYVDVSILLREIEELKYPLERLKISPSARIVTQEHKDWEADANLSGAIGSTGSGVGAAVMASIAREACNFPVRSLDADHVPELSGFIYDTTSFLRNRLDKGERVIVEGTQGFGLSLLDGGFWPKATSRSTTAAAALSEAGLSPLDVDDITMVIRSFPIRVAGDSGPLVGETTWEAVAAQAGRRDDLREYTTVTEKLRRVGYFDPTLVLRSIACNNPSRIVLNHLDYIGSESDLDDLSSELCLFILDVERKIGRKVDWYGFSGLDVTVPNREFV